MWLEWVVGGEFEWGTTISHGLHTIPDAMVPDGWHKTVAAWSNSQPSSCRRPLTAKLNQTTECLFPCLQSEADALPGMAHKLYITSNPPTAGL
jgi:hypothetical protein